MKKENMLAAMMFGGAGGGGGGGSHAAVDITYADLKAARNNASLVPGTVYRITDYVTKITGYYDLSSLGASGYLHFAKSAEHPFDIAVLALDESTLAENAMAIQHDGDTYFANSDLSAWELKYTIDNDPTRFSWADATNGKGVIFYLKDEFDNEAGFDFKNMLMPRYALAMADPDATPGSLAYDANDQPNRYGSATQIFTALQSYLQTGTYVNPWSGGYDFAVGANILGVIQFAELNSAYMSAFNADLYYTFDRLDGTSHTDLSLNPGASLRCYGNVIESTFDALAYFTSAALIPYGLNLSVFENTGGACSGNCLGLGAISNTFGYNCYSNTFGYNCYSNTFGYNCYSNTFGDYCYSNTFGYNCYSNTFGDYCYSNTFGDNCYSNTFGDNCYSNTFGYNCYSNTFGDNCDSNTFGYSCYSNTFGDSCYSNTFGDNCNSNTFGEFDQNNELQGYIRSTTLGKDIQYISVSGGTNGTPAEYYHICDHVRGTNGSPLSIVCTPLLTYETYVGYNSSGVLKTWCPADLA